MKAKMLIKSIGLVYRKIILLFALFVIHAICKGQIFKNLTDAVKDNLEFKAQDKLNQQINKGIDSLTKTHAKKNGKHTTDATNSAAGSVNSDSVPAVADSPDPDAGGNASSSGAPAADPSGQQDGFISVSYSALSTFPGGMIVISGESAMYGKFTTVGLIIKGPYTEDENPKPVGGFTKQAKQISLDKDGKFSTSWNVGGIDGEYIVTVTSSDGKVSKTQKIRVNSWPDMGDMADSNIEQTNKAYDKLVKKVEDVKPGISTKDAADLDKQMDKVKDKKDAAITLYTSINDAAKKLGVFIGKGKTLSPNLSANLSKLNNTLSSQASDMARMDEFTNHEPSENTICEILAMVNEACAAFSTFTNIYGATLEEGLQNIVLDKAVPTATGTSVETAGAQTGNAVDPDKEAVTKESSKLFATSYMDAKSLTTKLGPAGLVGDLVQSVNSYFLRKYCGLYEGTIKHDYTVIFRNSDHEIWWKYGVVMEATFSLRYPKGKSQGNTIKMKGNIEGNATKFTFFADSKAAVKDELQGRDNYVDVLVLKDFLPVAVPFSTSQNDKMGFGAAARAIATPAYFNIPVDVEYDLNGEKVKFFINPALIDFTDAVENRELFIVNAVLPMVRWQSYPIFKAQQMIKGSFKEKNEFPMTGGKTANPQCVDKVTRHIGKESDPFEIFLNTSFSVKKQ
jgi:hypothetical protein